MPICTPAQQALLPLLHPSVGTAPAGVSSGRSEPGRFPSICPCPAAAHPHGNSRPWAAQASCETPSASWGWRWQLRDTMGHLWCPILPRRWAWGAGEL